MTFSRKIPIMALACLAPLAAACTPATPETQLSWDANDHIESYRPAPAPARTARTYVYQGDGVYQGDAGDARIARDVPTPTPRPRDTAPAYQRTAYAPANTHRATIAFAWPASGKVISTFGTTVDGQRNDGINIAVPMGTPIHAAASGTVTYSGNELKDYGNLLLLKHDGGYVTAYAHVDRLLVQRGDFVSKGQVIGYAGRTGDVETPQLHFEIRRDTTPVDPSSLLVSRSS